MTDTPLPPPSIASRTTQALLAYAAHIISLIAMIAVVNVPFLWPAIGLVQILSIATALLVVIAIVRATRPTALRVVFATGVLAIWLLVLMACMFALGHSA